MKGKFSFNISVLWLVIMFIFGLAILLIAPKGELLSETENRMLTALPEANAETFLSGEFSEDFELFLTDKFFGRDSIVNLASECRGLFSILDFDDMLEFVDGVEDTFVDETLVSSDDDSVPNSENALPDNTNENSIEDKPVEGTNDPAESTSFPSTLRYKMYKANGDSITIYSLSKEDVKESAEIVNRFAELVPDGNVFYLNVLQAWNVNKYAGKTKTYTSWDNNVDIYMQSVVNDNVTVFSFTEIFDEPIRNGEYVFFRTDTHWTPLGAHYAYSTIISHQGIEPIPYNAYETTSFDNFLGSYYNMYKTAALKNNADRLDVLSPVIPVKYYKLTAKDTYKEVPLIDYNKGVEHGIYLGGNLGPLTVLRSEAGTGRKALLIKDSFGLIPSIYFSAHYDEFYLIDSRFFKKATVGYSVPQLIKEYCIDDIYFIVSDINGHGRDFTTLYTDRLV